MKARTEELLYLLMWGVETMTRTNPRKEDRCFERWVVVNGFHTHLAELQRRKLIEEQIEQTRAGVQRVVKLTQTGRLAALAEVDPEQAWSRPWDKVWRMVMFDVPDRENKVRVKLRRSLRRLRFGWLQNSVWLAPHPFELVERQIAAMPSGADALILFEGRPAGGEKDSDLVAAAWDWRNIKAVYDAWKQVADQAPLTALRGSEWPSDTLTEWVKRERDAWSKVMKLDPFLPSCLLPPDYPGKHCWYERLALFQNVGQGLVPG